MFYVLLRAPSLLYSAVITQAPKTIRRAGVPTIEMTQTSFEVTGHRGLEIIRQVSKAMRLALPLRDNS